MFPIIMSEDGRGLGDPLARVCVMSLLFERSASVRVCVLPSQHPARLSFLAPKPVPACLILHWQELAKMEQMQKKGEKPGAILAALQAIRKRKNKKWAGQKYASAIQTH